MAEAELAAGLAAFLGEAVARLERISEGHSRAMYRAELASGGRVVVRVEQGGVFGTSSVDEYALMAALHRRGAPVARPIGIEATGALIGRPFFVMEHVDGEGGAAVDEATLGDFGRRLHALHQLDVDGLPLDRRDPIERWAGVYRASCTDPIPLLEEADAWLHHHRPAPPARPGLVHGDAGPGNFVWVPGEVRAFTDWEFAHLGDPAEDWVFCATMRGAGLGDRDRWQARIATWTGRALTAEQWRYWEAFNLFKGACANASCAALFERGEHRMPNMVIIGTALHHVFVRRLAALVG